MSTLRFLSALALLTLISSQALASEPWTARLHAADETLSERLAQNPDSQQLLSQRGDVRLFQGRFAEAVADFEKMIALNPALDAPHWRLGIAYYFSGAFEKASRQFQKYHSHDGRDRENGLWKFMADSQSLGLTEARKIMLEYTRFDREPFPALYELFAGNMAVEEFVSILPKGTDGTGREPESAPVRQIRFFGCYYAGVYLSLTGKREDGLRLVREAVSLFDDTDADRVGPGYMWRVAVVHTGLLRK